MCIWVYFRHACKYRTCRLLTIRNSVTRHRSWQSRNWTSRFKLLPLLSKSVEISSLSLQRPSVERIKDAQGTWNFSTIGATQKSAPSQSKQQFSLGQLAVQDGQVRNQQS